MRRVLAGLALAAAACGCDGTPTAAQAEHARQHHVRQEQRLDELLARDGFVSAALAGGGDVQVALKSELATAVVRDVARLYLDHVELDLALEKSVHAEGTLEVGTPFGKMTAGQWQADVVVHRVRGALAAGEPQLGVPAENRVRVTLPVELRKAEGSATVRFKWDARKLAKVVCRDFEVKRTIRGRLLSQEYTLEGAVRLVAGPRAVRAEPAFGRSPFRLRMDLLPASWSEVEQAVQEQDKLLRCGLALDPRDVMPKLSQLLRNGFDVRLPRSLFRPVDLPASVGGSVSLWGRDVELSLATEGLEVTPESVRYRARITTRQPTQAP